MKKKSVTAILVAVALSLSGCGERTDTSDEDVIVKEGVYQIQCVEGCTCTGCICCGTVLEESSVAAEMTVEESVQEESAEETQSAAESAEERETEQSETQQEQQESEEDKGISELSEGELKARREQQNNFVEARQLLYALPNSKDKTTKINQMDRQILANNAYDFSQKNIVFIGDSITEGITSAVDIKGNLISYVNYADFYLHFNRVLNHGVGGRMFADYGGNELSLSANFGNVTNMDSDIIVVFAGVNDYLSTPENKRFGDINDTLSTAGYCGAVRYFMRELQTYYGDREIFFVTMYNNSKKAQSTYSDITGQPTLNDYMEVQRKLADEFGYHIIELYDIGFMDCSDKESSDFYLRDGLHPKDNGNIVLGEHIAAELSLYFGQKEVD
ncbi:MAG: SGNH/GDSL hydrolase family protein [Lachnospiraceae bacterium]|nr:SGNH/GDSL hydrolase family protein [Lachnospiraceae bacterium]